MLQSQLLWVQMLIECKKSAENALVVIQETLGFFDMRIS